VLPGSPAVHMCLLLLAPPLEPVRLHVEISTGPPTKEHADETTEQTCLLDADRHVDSAVVALPQVMCSNRRHAGTLHYPRERSPWLQLRDTPDQRRKAWLLDPRSATNCQFASIKQFDPRHGGRPLRPALNIAENPPDAFRRRVDVYGAHIAHGQIVS
jgi:hypothetical protein